MEEIKEIKKNLDTESALKQLNKYMRTVEEIHKTNPKEFNKYDRFGGYLDRLCVVVKSVSGCKDDNCDAVNNSGNCGECWNVYMTYDHDSKTGEWTKND